MLPVYASALNDVFLIFTCITQAFSLCVRDAMQRISGIAWFERVKVCIAVTERELHLRDRGLQACGIVQNARSCYFAACNVLILSQKWAL